MAAFPSLSSPPVFPMEPDGELADVIIRNDTTGGYELTRPRTTRARRMWGIRYELLTDADIATLRTFETTTLRNGADSFTWTHPSTGSSYTVRLAAPIKFSKVRNNMNGVSFGLKEV